MIGVRIRSDNIADFSVILNPVADLNGTFMSRD